MRNDYTIYIIVCFLSILFSLINRVYPIGGKEYLLFSGYVKVRFLEMCLVGYRRLVANLNCLTSNYMSYAWE